LDPPLTEIRTRKLNILFGKNVEFMLNLVVRKVITKRERVKKLNFICGLKYYTFILGSLRENSDLFIGVSQI
jgi:hypothetical protein